MRTHWGVGSPARATGGDAEIDAAFVAVPDVRARIGSTFGAAAGPICCTMALVTVELWIMLAKFFNDLYFNN